MSVAAVILAAGFSRRLRWPKQTIEIGGETLIERAVRVANEAGLCPVLVVVRPQASFLNDLRALRCSLVANDDAEEGIAASIRAGVRALEDMTSVAGAVLMTCDQIGTNSEHLRALCAEPHRVTGSGYARKVAVPAYFPRSSFEQLLALHGDMGARPLLRGAHSIQADGLGLDIDTEEDVLRARMLFERGSPAQGTLATGAFTRLADE